MSTEKSDRFSRPRGRRAALSRSPVYDCGDDQGLRPPSLTCQSRAITIWTNKIHRRIKVRRVHAKHLKVATRQTPRAINRQIVLRLLRAHQAISRADLASLLEMQRSAAGPIGAELIAQGLVREGAPGPPRPGRK